MALIDDIEAFLKAHRISPTAFGMKALNDPPFVQQLRSGRDVKESTSIRVRKFMAEYAEAAAASENVEAAE